MKKYKILTAALCMLVMLNLRVFGDVSTVGISVDTPTQSQIIQFVRDNPVMSVTDNKVGYDIKPSIKQPYSAGKVSEKYLMDGLNAVNIARYIAGISSNVTLDKSYINLNQAGAVLLAAGKQFTHTPTRPVGMDESFYQKGYQGTSQSNISCGYTLLSQSVLLGYLKDGDKNNVDRVGHRRWVLNPKMGKTGFGFVPGNYSTMYAFDNSNSSSNLNYSVIAWPAQHMPIEYFEEDAPFSLSLTSDFNVLSRTNVSVRMTRKSDGKVFSFNSQTSSNPASRVYFNVNNDGYAEPRCIIWKPEVSSYLDGDEFAVEITGVKKGGNDYPISYTVAFFKLAPNSESSPTPSPKPPTTTTTISSSGNRVLPIVSKVALNYHSFNPAKNGLKIAFKANRSGLLYCKIYNSKNVLVRTVASGRKITKSGSWSIVWNGKSSQGYNVAAGKYRIALYLADGKNKSKTQNAYVKIWR